MASHATAGNVTYTYDNGGRLTMADYGGGNVITYTYDAAGNLLTETVVSTVADAYEPDDSSGQATTIAPGASQTHSISPVGDEDWMTFTLTDPSGIVLETSGSGGDDTQMWLYDSSLIEIESDDNSGTGNYSMIDRVCGSDELSAGTYYVKIQESGNDEEINSYDISLTVTPSCDPVLDIKANSSDGPVILSQGDNLNVTITLDPGSRSGEDADWWVVADTSFGRYHYDKGSGLWAPGLTVTYQGQLVNSPQTTVLDTTSLPVGSYTFYFGVDMIMNGILDMGSMFNDSVLVNITQ